MLGPMTGVMEVVRGGFKVLVDQEGLAIVRNADGTYEGTLHGADIEDVDVDAYAARHGLQVDSIESASDTEHFFVFGPRERSLIG